jgi:predicted  nucleic acid-binding Zn-ribbon protein
MIASQTDQKQLLAIAAFDVELARISNSRKQAQAESELEAASAETLRLSDSLIDARNAVGDLEMELGRAEADLELVGNRITKDKQLLRSTSSAKDAQGIEHELGTLDTRKSELEDAQLQIMELLELAQKNHEQLSQEKQAADTQLAAVQERISTELADLSSQAEKVQTERKSAISSIDQELAGAYERKYSRGVAVGRLTGRDCGACRLSITATSFEELMALPSEELAECPNCQAFLVRS